MTVNTIDLEPFPPDLRDKVFRLADLAQRIYSVPFLSTRLAFYGGTCLNFVHLGRVNRLSLDLDFNFREEANIDWGSQRDVVDTYIKEVLADLGYADDDIRIQVSYPLTRFEIWYRALSGKRYCIN